MTDKNKINADGTDEPLVGSAVSNKSNKHAKYDDHVKNFTVKGNSKIDNGLV